MAFLAEVHSDRASPVTSVGIYGSVEPDPHLSRKFCLFVFKSANSWPQSAIASPQISEVCQSANPQMLND